MSRPEDTPEDDRSQWARGEPRESRSGDSATGPLFERPARPREPLTESRARPESPAVDELRPRGPRYDTPARPARSFERVDTPDPERMQRPRASEWAEPAGRTDVIPRSGRQPDVRPRPVRRVRPGVRRVRRTVRHVDPISIFKVSLFCYTFALAMWLLFVAVVYSVLNNFGVFETIEDVVRIFVLSDDKIDLTLGRVERWAFVVGLGVMFVGSIANMLLAFIYNIAADVIGGVQVTFIEREV